MTTRGGVSWDHGSTWPTFGGSLFSPPDSRRLLSRRREPLQEGGPSCTLVSSCLVLAVQDGVAIALQRVPWHQMDTVCRRRRLEPAAELVVRHSVACNANWPCGLTIHHLGRTWPSTVGGSPSSNDRGSMGPFATHPKAAARQGGRTAPDGHWPLRVPELRVLRGKVNRRDSRRCQAQHLHGSWRTGAGLQSKEEARMMFRFSEHRPRVDAAKRWVNLFWLLSDLMH